VSCRWSRDEQGIGDAISLARKLNAILDGKAPDRFLHSYEAERIASARPLVKTTDQLFTLATAQGQVTDIIRTKVVPVVLAAAVHFVPWRESIFRAVMMYYRHGLTGNGDAGEIQGCDRLPWVKLGI
jgi:2-polyprenyl-6-methoxyphenol hydroxylase-like FAD-dependent oxidoreductase